MVIIALFAFFLFVLGILCLGYILYSKGYENDKLPLSFHVGASYFTGLALWIAILRACDFVLHDVNISLWITLLVSSIILACFRHTVFLLLKKLVKNKTTIYALVMLGILCPFLLVYWLPPTTNPEDVNQLIGSLHSGRYVGLSNYILSCNFIPVLGQNIGQSLLVASVGSFLLDYPFLYLFLFLLSSTFFLALFIYGFIYSISARVSTSFWSSFIFMVANSSFSFAHVMSIDSGSPFLLNGYTDTLLGTFIVIMLILLFVARESIILKTKGRILFLAVLLNASFISSPQNIILFSSALFLTTFYFIIKEKTFKFKPIWAVFLLVTLISVPEGGMLTPSKMQNVIPLVGMQSVGNSQAGIRLNPWVPFYITIKSGWEDGNDQTRWFRGEGLFTVYKDAHRHISERIYFYEQTIFMGLRNLFFPTFGIAVLFLLLRNKDLYKGEIQHFKMLKAIYTLGAFFLACGVIISYPVMVNSYKLELARFLIPGITIGLLCFILSLTFSIKLGLKNLKIILLILGGISTLGPISNSVSRVVTHIAVFTDLPFKQLVSSGEPVYDELCIAPSKTALARKKGTEKIQNLSLIPLPAITPTNSYIFDLTDPSSENSVLSSVGVLISSSGLYNPGYLELELQSVGGIIYKNKISSRNVKENQYNTFELDPREYVSAELSSVEPGNIVPWSSSNKVCLALKYEHKTVFTSGCPKPDD
jgi:hypothetical protein